jgi:adiponectin receptor
MPNIIFSLAYLHNETVNIWTHLLGSITAILTSIYLYKSLKPRYDSANQEDMVVFSCFFFGAASCLGMSATFHTICNHSPEVARWGNQLDYLGIVCLIWGSFIPSIYYGFEGEEGLRNWYWSMVSLKISFLFDCVSHSTPLFLAAAIASTSIPFALFRGR